MQKRVAFWDNYKGILIALVVFGHFIYSTATTYPKSFLNDVFTFIYLFHMPAFVFCSGYLSKSENTGKKPAIVQLLLYYLVFNSAMMLWYQRCTTADLDALYFLLVFAGFDRLETGCPARGAYKVYRSLFCSSYVADRLLAGIHQSSCLVPDGRLFRVFPAGLSV